MTRFMKWILKILMLGVVTVSVAGTEELWVSPEGRIEIIRSPGGDACPLEMEELRGLDGLFYGCIVPYPYGGTRVPEIDCTSEKLMDVLENLLKYVKDPNEARGGVMIEPAIYRVPLDPADELRHRADLIEQMSKAVREARGVLRACRAGGEVGKIMLDPDADGTVNVEVEIVELGEGE